MKLFLFLFACAFSTLFGKVIIHMDVNRTIISRDSQQSYSPEDFVNLCFAKRTYALWDETLETPLSFYEYVYTKMLPGSRSDRPLRRKRRAVIHNFIEYLKNHEHPQAPSILREYPRAVKAVKEVGDSIFPSFFSLISHLEKNNIDYTIIFRTFGGDLHCILDEVAALYKINSILHFTTKNGTLFKVDQQTSYSDVLSECLNMRFVGIQDDFHYWNRNNESALHAKTFPLCENHVSLFFDDNIEEDNEETNIVSPIRLETGAPLPIIPLIKSGHIVKVDTLSAITNKNYFIEKLQHVIQEP